jgi:mannosyltransferase OCH1-like enzyme
MWNFKPRETKAFPMDVVSHNKTYIEKYSIETPLTTESLSQSDMFPNIIKLIKLIPHWIIKADLLRLLIVYFNGGIYSDADCFIRKPTTIHGTNDNILLFIEHICPNVNMLGPRECKNQENRIRIANYYFGSKVKHHPFLKEVIEECIVRLNRILIQENNTSLTQQDILWVCGPDVITTVYHRSRHNYNDIFLYDNTYLDHKCYSSWR